MDTKVLLADDHAMLRSSVKTICASNGIHNLDEVGSCRNLLSQLHKEKYTHLVLDLLLSDGDAMEILDMIRTEYPGLEILVFSSQSPVLYRGFLRKKYGCYFISKSEPEMDSIRSLIAFLKGKMSVNSTPADTQGNPFALLSSQEGEITHYLLMGWSTHSIAEKCEITEDHVRSAIRHILHKTGAKDRDMLKVMANRLFQ
jgi:two-component system invasion response regulator UvrY